jgi:outer membrane protein assembly factor BamB
MVRGIKAVALGVTIAMVVGSCTDAGSDESSDGSATRTERTSSSVARFELAAQPLWRGDAGGLPEVMTAAWLHASFFDDVLFLEQSSSPMAVVNPATGEPYWTADPELLVGGEAEYGDVDVVNSTGRAPVARTGDDWVVFVESAGTAALRLKDASPLWRVPRPTGHYEIVAADERIVLLSLGARGDQPVARAIGAADGATTWETPGVWARFVAGDRVLGTVSSQPPDLAADDSYVVGLDAATGQRVWSLEGRYQRSEIGFVAGAVALVYTRAGAPESASAPRDAATIIDMASGAEIAQLGWDFGAKNSCAADSDRLIACTLDVDPKRSASSSVRVVTFDVARRAKHVSPRQDGLDEALVRKVRHDYIFVGDGREDMWAVDQDGVVVSDKLPGTLIGISDEYAVFATADRGVPAVYKIGE